MKNLFKASAAAAALAVGAMAVQADDVSEETRDLGAFDEVYLMGSMDVEIKVGGTQSVRVVADSDIIEHVETKIKGDGLRIGMERGNYRNIKRMTVYITVPSLDAAGIHGSGDMLVDGAKADDFDMDIHGSGNATFNDPEFGKLDLNVHGSGDSTFKNAKFGDVDISVHGSGDIEMDGSCDEIEIGVQGSGDVEVDDLTCKTADVTVQGSGDVSVHASETAKVSIHGSGDVDVHGNPDKLRTNVRGSGDIEVR
ncbi:MULTISPECIES: head GIN domain-containing protein [Kordiimonas]|jgi:hypothetical protein|uniref:Putative auto-transporter adhesin, head GIN domain n=1 Tax=Kordiimonas lacus TaxID=637679 RepID=A0A1G6UMC2_9PROT|nr:MULTISPECIES: head GIN domain-containing protein [Kordiimonas]SDD41717.1 Putative auto-transporter adhesin, head GIN domain [Kordiimonas lacus]